MTSAALPALPEPYFFRVEEGWFFGPTVRVQLRRRWRLGPLRWSTREEVGWSTQEILEVSSDDEVAALIARRQASDLAARLRPGNLTLRGDHP